MAKIKTVLFDLDGTLIDTAPDMVAALDKLCAEEEQTVLPFETVRPVVSNGSVALVKLAFGENVDNQRLEYLKNRYLKIYEEDIAVDSRLFEGTQTVLDYLAEHDMNWGVVTNKPGWLTLPLMKALGLEQQAACIVSGDSTENRKPHPEPMHHACELAGSKSEECIYVGDARRDIEAGNNAGMKTLIASYGYIGEHEDTNSWGADALINDPEEILKHLA
jgi:phosphoglycolate phosphatase